jgi:ATP-dependent DNA ligase
MFRDACQSGLEGIIAKHRDPRIDPDKPATG